MTTSTSQLFGTDLLRASYRDARLSLYRKKPASQIAPKKLMSLSKRSIDVLLYAPQFVRDRFNIFIQFLKNGARNLASNEPNQFRYWTVLYQSAASFHGVARNPNGPPKFFQFSPSRHLNWIFNHGPLHFQEPIRHNFVVIFSRTCYSLPSSFSLSPKSKWFL